MRAKFTIPSDRGSFQDLIDFDLIPPHMPTIDGRTRLTGNGPTRFRLTFDTPFDSVRLPQTDAIVALEDGSTYIVTVEASDGAKTYTGVVKSGG